jgi:hypothetical protein
MIQEYAESKRMTFDHVILHAKWASAFIPRQRQVGESLVDHPLLKEDLGKQTVDFRDFRLADDNPKGNPDIRGH